ncbi:hypothetical protein C8Q73DRAFT_623089, partial [Cubamyces lactineus]
PNFAGPVFARVRKLLVKNGKAENDEEAGDFLLAEWLEARETEQAKARNPHTRDSPTPPPARNSNMAGGQGHSRECDTEEEQMDTKDKGKAKTLPPIPRGKPAPLSVSKPITPFAVNKLRNKQYVKLWYFTEEGLNRAAGSNFSYPDNVVMVSHTDSAIHVSVPAPPSKDVKKDEELTWDQVSKARTLFLQNAKMYGWGDEHLEVLAIFFLALDAHPIRNEVKGNQTVVRYQARYRRQWHLSMDQGSPFDLSVINEEALHAIRRDI